MSEKKPSLYFGADASKKLLIKRIDEHFAGKDEFGSEPLVTGIYGAWGSGKTQMLRALETHYGKQLSLDKNSANNNQKTANEASEPTPTIPIFFNPWRYENEPHLIIPLLRTAEYRLRHYAKLENSLQKFAHKIHVLQDIIVGLAAGFSLSFGISDNKVNFTADKAMDRLKSKKQQRQHIKNIESHQSIYYDTLTHMSQLTGHEPDTEKDKLNLLFLN